MTDTTTDPIIVTASPAADQVGAATRDILLIVSALPALVTVLGTHDVQQIVNYLGGAGFAPVLGVIVTAAVMGWRQIVARRRKAALVTVAETPPHAIIVK